MKLIDYLHQQKISQADAARALQVTPWQMSRWCAGATRPRSAQTMRRIAAWSGGLVTADDFYRDGQACDKQ